jgi:phosphoglycerol transferase MdoB-like AlkP superfamily enzyme
MDRARERVPKNRLFLGWMSSTTHTPFIINPEWKKDNYQEYIQGETSWDTVNGYLNAVRWSDDKVKEIILGFRERGLEDETLFIMYFSPAWHADL